MAARPDQVVCRRRAIRDARAGSLTGRGQACVIERTRRTAVVRPLSGPVLVQANHHVAGAFAANNADIIEGTTADDLFSLAGSNKRADALSDALAAVPAACALDVAADALNREPVLNADTCQQMVFVPAAGEVRVWRRAGG